MRWRERYAARVHHGENSWLAASTRASLVGHGSENRWPMLPALGTCVRQADPEFDGAAMRGGVSASPTSRFGGAGAGGGVSSGESKAFRKGNHW
jgi:hypothetical protein